MDNSVEHAEVSQTMNNESISVFPSRRIMDLAMACLALLAFGIPMLLIAALIKLTSKGPVFYWSDRVGVNKTIFKMPKFRTMRLNTPAVATHLLTNPQNYLTPIGGILRKFSLDELPQIFSILRGDITVIGPRPALFNQDDLVALRARKGIDRMVPGLTGWAQINGRDNLSIPEKVAMEEYYLVHRSFLLDLKILVKTLVKVLNGDGVTH